MPSSWFLKIETREQAVTAIKGAANVFFFVSVLLVVVSFLLGFNIWWYAAIYASCGLFLRKFNSRVAAVISLTVSAISVLIIVANIADSIKRTGGINIVLALIILWVSVRAVQATFKLRQLGTLSGDVA